jgi:diketogulonate reductase-like aldo/keto reductase
MSFAARTPWILYGTAWKEDATEACVRLALEAGFRGIDTANQRKHYVEAGVGSALGPFIAAHGRESVFLQTKFTYARGQDHRLPYDPKAPPAEQVRQSFQRSLEHLGVAEIDSYVLHGPERSSGISEADREVWSAMEQLEREARVRHLGISNLSAEQLRELVGAVGTPPSFVQNRCYARDGWDAEVRAICRANGIVYQGFSLLTANRNVWEGAALAAIAKRHGATPAQVVFAFARSLGMLPLTGTRDPEHMREDLGAERLELDPAELRALGG